MLGAQEDIIPLLSAADVFLLPSAQESFGLAALEAMACEVPVVASNVGGLPEVIDARRERVPARPGRSRRDGAQRDCRCSPMPGCCDAASPRPPAVACASDSASTCVVPMYEAHYARVRQ